MLVKVLDAISNRLYENFGEFFKNGEVKIYTEESTQGISNPCFFITFIENPFNRELFNQYRHEAIFSINYLSSKNETLSRKLEILEKLKYVMEYIYIDEKPIWGALIKADVQDEEPQLIIRYNYKTIRDIHHPKPDIESPDNKGEVGEMEKLFYNAEVKNGEEKGSN